MAKAKSPEVMPLMLPISPNAAIQWIFHLFHL
jgi:hypothetical protein